MGALLYHHVIARFILVYVVSMATAQDMMDDTGGDAGGGEDMGDLLDPTLLIGEGNTMNYGQGPDGMPISQMEKLSIQTLSALQELGVVLGVAFLVAVIFFVIIYTEKFVMSIMVR